MLLDRHLYNLKKIDYNIILFIIIQTTSVYPLLNLTEPLQQYNTFP